MRDFHIKYMFFGLPLSPPTVVKKRPFEHRLMRFFQLVPFQLTKSCGDNQTYLVYTHNVFPEGLGLDSDAE